MRRQFDAHHENIENNGRADDAAHDPYRRHYDLFDVDETSKQWAEQQMATEIEDVREALTATDSNRQFWIAKHVPHLAIYLLRNPNITRHALGAIETDDPEVHELLARHPNCPQKWLETLSVSSSPEVRALSGAHPNNSEFGRRWAQEEDVDPDEPWAGVRYEPYGVYEGVLPLLSPDLASAHQYAIASVEAERFEDEYRIESTVARHPNAPGFALARIASKLLPRIKKNAHRRSEIDTFGHEPVNEVGQRINDAAVVLEVLQLVARHPNTPAKVMRTLRDTYDPSILGALAMSPTCQLPTLKRVLKIDDATLRRQLAAHPSRRIREIARQLRHDAANDIETLAVLAANPHLATHHLEALIALDHDQIAAALAANPAMERRAILALADHPSLPVRTAVAAHAAVDADIIQALRRRNTPVLAEALAANPQTPTAYLHAIRSHSTTTKPVHMLLAANPNIGPEAMREYADDHTIARALASNTALPEDVQRHLVRSPSTGIVALVTLADNPATTAATLRHLTGYGAACPGITLHPKVDAHILDECEMGAATDVKLWVHVRIARLVLDRAIK